MLLGTKEKAVTKITFEFLNNLIPLFEQFVLLFQKSSPVVHVLYDSMCDILAILVRRFMKTKVLEKKYGSDLASIEWKDLKLQLTGKDIVIGDSTKKALKELSPDQQRNTVLGICSFFGAILYLQQKLSLSNQLLRQHMFLNPSKRKKDSTISSILSLTSALQPKVFETEVVNKCKVFQVDNDLPAYDPKERIEVFWKQVFELQASNGDYIYKVLPVVLKSALLLAQTNAEIECTFSVNARIVTEERPSLGEKQ